MSEECFFEMVLEMFFKMKVFNKFDISGCCEESMMKTSSPSFSSPSQESMSEMMFSSMLIVFDSRSCDEEDEEEEEEVEVSRIRSKMGLENGSGFEVFFLFLNRKIDLQNKKSEIEKRRRRLEEEEEEE